MEIFYIIKKIFFPFTYVYKEPHKFRNIDDIKIAEYNYKNMMRTEYRISILYLLFVIGILYTDAFLIHDLPLFNRLIITYITIYTGFRAEHYKKYEKQRIEDGKVEYLKRKMKGELK